MKNLSARNGCDIRFHDIGDYLSQQDKLKIIHEFGSAGGIAAKQGWNKIFPNEHGDWLNQRNQAFEAFLPMGDKSARGATEAIFRSYSLGVATGRDRWCYNASYNEVANNMRRMIDFYNAEVERYVEAGEVDEPERFVNPDATRISWNRNLIQDLARTKKHEYSQGHIVPSMYRPFNKEWLYFSREMNAMVYQNYRVFPDDATSNLVIVVSGKGARNFSALMVNSLVSLDAIEKGQGFPLFWHERPETSKYEDLFGQSSPPGFVRHDGLTDASLAHFRSTYKMEAITKEDIFYYVYGILHSPSYRAGFADNLSKELPRIPGVKKVEDFWAFSRAGRALGELHVNYEEVEPYPVTIREGDLRLADIKDPEAFYRVEKMRFGGKRPNIDKSTVIYNSNITMQDVPLEAYEYIVNGKPALEWVMERQVVKTDKASGIVNDANRYAIETVGDPAYPLKLFQRVVTVSLETMKIVNSLPPLDIDA